jgi:hypothetical protein
MDALPDDRREARFRWPFSEAEEALPMDLTPDERRQVEDAVVAALKALLDLPIDLKCVAVDLIVDRVSNGTCALAASASRAGELRRDVLSSPSMDENDRARLDRHEKALAELKTMAFSLAERVLVVESLTDGIPLSTADHFIAKQALAERRAPHEEARLRVEAFRRAQPRRRRPARASRSIAFCSN